jgi:uncharacterized protein (DUF2236 family)
MAALPQHSLHTLRDRVARVVRQTLAGTPDEPVYDYDPTEERRFSPDSAIWEVHTDVSMLIGGLRALLLQTLHPLALAGVTQHSTYRSDPLGRLQRTGAFIATTTFGTTTEAEQVISMVRAVHARVNGVASDGRPYSALDPHLLAWVHCTEADSFLRARQRYGTTPLAESRADEYVAQIGQIGEALGVVDPPQSREELRQRLLSYRDELTVGPDTRETVRFLAFPPLSLAARPSYGVIFAAAASMLPGFARRMLMIPVAPLAEPIAIRPAATGLMRTLNWALGEHPAVLAAREGTSGGQPSSKNAETHES